MSSNTQRRSRTWEHAKRVPVPQDSSSGKIDDKGSVYHYHEEPPLGKGTNSTGAEGEATPEIIIPETELGSSNLGLGPGPESVSSASVGSADTTTDGSPDSTSITFPTTSAESSTPSVTPITESTTITASSAAETTPSSIAVPVSGALSHSSSGVPAVAIGLIVASLVIIFAAVTVFILRRRSIRAREQKRQTWNKNIFTKQQEARAEQEKAFGGEQPAPPYDDIVAPPMSYNAILPPSQAMFAPRPMSENSVSTAATRRSLTHTTPPPPMPSAPPATPASVAGAASVSTNRSEATRVNIVCTFIPCLPDELSISTGETVRVLAEYDDGWAMCVNGSGEQGMVPTECLDRGNGRVGSGDWRASRRVSSLPRSRY